MLTKLKEISQWEAEGSAENITNKLYPEITNKSAAACLRGRWQSDWMSLPLPTNSPAEIHRGARMGARTAPGWHDALRWPSHLSCLHFTSCRCSTLSKVVSLLGTSNPSSTQWGCSLLPRICWGLEANARALAEGWTPRRLQKWKLLLMLGADRTPQAQLALWMKVLVIRSWCPGLQRG